MRRPPPQPPAVRVPPQSLAALVAPVRAAGLLAAEPEALDGVEIRGVTDDSRQAGPGWLFGAISPDSDAARDGHDFVPAALAQGAAAALVRADYTLPEAPASLEATASDPVPLGKGERLPSAVLVRSTDSRAALAEAAAAFYGRAADRLTLLGITGTNGKTTTAVLLHELFQALGQTAGLVGTIENRIGGERYATPFTTPEAVALQRLLRAMADAGVGPVAMEVSSHGLALDRVRTLGFRAAVFTNLTHDHLDFHGSAAAYEAAKKRLFDGLGPDAVAVVNADDPAHARMTAGTAARVVTFGTAPGADVRVEVLANTADGLRLRLDGHEVQTRLAGRYNALNLAAAYAVARDLGLAAADVVGALAEVRGVPGRFETVRSADGVLGVVDYAHTPDALDNVLATAAEIVPAGARLWVVFGAGGDRDPSKRAPMGAVATRHTAHAIITSDNPRTESPAAIVADVAAGAVRPAAEILDRAAAIAHAAREATPGDVIVVAGKGHEDYQVVGAEARHFDDREELRAAFAARPAAAHQTEGAA